MPKHYNTTPKTNQKLKFISLIDLLKKFSDENHPLNAPDIINLLNSKGIKCERKYIYKTLDTLAEYGMDINHTHYPKQGFYLGARTFEIAEIKILIDAVLSAPFITRKKSEELVKKLENQLSIYQSETISKNKATFEKSKLGNEEIYYNIDTINDAIFNNKKITFNYHHLVIKDNKITINDGKKFVVSPYALIWCNDRYYLVCNYSKYNCISHYRIDRMKKVSILNEPSRSCAEVSHYKNNNDFNSIEYTKKNFAMYSGKEENIELICDNSVLEILIDKFGTDIKIKNYSSTQFKAYMTLAIGNPFIGWLIDNADKVYVKSPIVLQKTIKNKIKNIYSSYFSQCYTN